MIHNLNRLSPTSVLLLAVVACTFASTPAATESPDGTGEVNPTPGSPVVQHQSIPGDLPAERSSHAGDHDSSPMADKKRAPGGDRFTFGRFERPFNANTMDVYYPYLDIQDTLFYEDDTWIYAVIVMKGANASQELAGKYAVEIDANLDGGGDWLVLADQPASTDWSTAGVQVWFDTNDDVGGSNKLDADAESSGNGYETVIFDQDQGEDPDLAFARVSPDDAYTVQIATKRSLLAGDDSFLAGMWAGGAILDPALFDLNDHYTHEQAGAALVELEYFYPIKSISELDNSCRMAIGFQPNGSEPGLCEGLAPSGPGSCKPPAGGCDTGSGFHWDETLCCCSYYDLGCNYSP